MCSKLGKRLATLACGAIFSHVLPFSAKHSTAMRLCHRIYALVDTILQMRHELTTFVEQKHLKVLEDIFDPPLY